MAHRLKVLAALREVSGTHILATHNWLSLQSQGIQYPLVPSIGTNMQAYSFIWNSKQDCNLDNSQDSWVMPMTKNQKLHLLQEAWDY